jgi:hypothetical protein
MKTVTLTIALLTIALLGSIKAQDVGFNINRGVTTLCPDYRSLTSTLNQGYGFGLTKYRPLKKDLFLKTGVNLSVLRSCRAVYDPEGLAMLIPEKYTYIDVPMTVEKQFFRYSPITRRATHFNLSAGINFAYLLHEEGFDQELGSGFQTNPLNVGAHLAAQIVKPVNWNTAFAIGPFIQVYSTNEQPANMAFYTGFKLDWKFGKLMGRRN